MKKGIWILTGLLFFVTVLVQIRMYYEEKTAILSSKPAISTIEVEEGSVKVELKGTDYYLMAGEKLSSD
jgi:hypothetical protein